MSGKAKKGGEEGVKIGRRIARNYRKKYKLHDLCYSRKVKEIKELLQQNDTEAIEMLNEKAGVLGYTPLHEAASSGLADVLELLLMYGGDPNATSGGDYTPLHIAATIGDCECIRVLLENGADIKQEDEHHKTPYLKAKLNGRVRAARQLLSAEVIAAAAVNDPNLGKKIADLQPGKDIEENCFDRALEKAVIANHHRATGFLCLEGCKNITASLQKAVKRAGCYQAAVMLLLCHAAHQGDVKMIKAVIEGFNDRKRFLEEEKKRKKSMVSDRRLALTAGASNPQLKRPYLPQEWEGTLPFHILENLRDEATHIEMAFPICVAVNNKKYEAAKLFLLETLTSAEYKYVDWHGLALNVLLDDWIRRVGPCEKLILSRNTITRLPKSIVTLKALNRLDLSENRLTKVPKQIFEMQTLKNLNLAGNKLQVLPDVEDWGQLMTILNLKGNFLNALPEGIMESNLVDLNIAGNLFLQFPRCVCSILTLRQLDISKNRYITVLPPEVGKLRKLQTLLLNDMDQITDPPPAMRRNTMTLIRHLEATLRGSEPYYHMKLMFVGLANKGKTTLLRRLQGDFQFNGNQSTVGVDIREVTIKKGHPYTFKCWDFAGQEEYYATHQCFLSQRSLYLLVWDLRDGEEGINQLRPWLDNLGTRVPHSTVIIVGTHYDKIPNDKIKDGFTQKITEQLYALVGSREIYRKLRVPNSGYIFVGKDMRDRIDHLRTVIYATAEKMTVDGTPQGTKIMGDRVPSCYLQLARAISDKLNELYNERKIPILKREEYAGLLFEHSKKTSRDIFPDDLELATTFLHNIGVILHYDDPNQNLKDLYFIDPSWLCQLMGQVVTVKEVHSFFVRGILDISTLSQIIKASNTKFPPEFYPQYLRLLYRFQIACKVDDSRILVPSVLPLFPPDNFESAVSREPMLERVYSLVCIPPGFWSRFIGRLLLYMPGVLGPVKSNDTSPENSCSEKHVPKISNSSPEDYQNTIDSVEHSEGNDKAIPNRFISESGRENLKEDGKGFQKQLSIVLNNCILSVGQDSGETPSSTRSTPMSEDCRLVQGSFPTSLTLGSSEGSGDSGSGHLNGSEDSSFGCMTQESGSDLGDERGTHPEVAFCPSGSCGNESSSANAHMVQEKRSSVEKDCEDDAVFSDSLAVEDSAMLSTSVRSEDLPRFFYRRSTMEEHADSTVSSLLNGSMTVNDALLDDRRPCDEPGDESPNDETRETTVVEIPERANEFFDGAKLYGSSLPDSVTSDESAERPTYEGERDISSLLDKGVLKCWRTGILFQHPDLLFSISQAEDEDEREVIRMKVSRTPLGFSVLGRIIDHFRTLIKEWYPGYTGDDGRQPFILGFVPCPLCIDFNFPQVHKFDIRHCLANFFGNDYVLCPNNHTPRVIKLVDICPDLAFRDLDKNLILHSSALQFTESKDHMIGEGKFGTVYRGKCRSMAAAVKVYNFNVDIDDTSLALEKFYDVRQEVIVLSKLKKHPLIIGFLGVCLAPRLCATMELAGKGTLKDPLHKRPIHILRSVIYRIAYQLISALAYLHSLGLIHRDLKSDNVLLFSIEPEAEVNIKLADFGTTDFISSTGLKYMAGTVGYHAPEMLEYSKTDEYTPKVDVYSFGIVQSELITRRRPFYDSDSELAVGALVKDGKRPRFSDIPSAYYGFLSLTELMLKTWEGDPVKRPSSALVQKQFEDCTFSLLMGKYQLDYMDSPRSMCSLPSISETWIACYGCEGPFVVVLDMESGKLKRKFRPTHGKTKSVNLNIVDMYLLGDDYVGVVLRSVQDFLFVRDATKEVDEKKPEVHIFGDSFILAMTYSIDYIFIGFYSGKIVRLNRKEFLKGKIRDLVEIPSPKQNFPVRCLAVDKDDLFVAKDDNVYVYSIKALQLGSCDPKFTFYQDGRDSVSQIEFSQSLGLTFFTYTRSSKITCLRSSDKHIIGEIDCGPIVQRELRSINENDERVTVICLTYDALWAGTGSGHVLIFEGRFEALPISVTPLRPYLLETRLMTSYRKPAAGVLVHEVVVTSGKEVNPCAYSRDGEPLLILDSSFPIDTNDIKRVNNRRRSSIPTSPISFAGSPTSELNGSSSPPPPPNPKLGKMVLFWEAMHSNVMRKFPGSGQPV